MKGLLKRFATDDSGAITVDWVVLTAATVGLAILIMANVRSGVQDGLDDMSAKISAIE